MNKKDRQRDRKGAILLMTLGLLAIMVIFMFTFLEYAHKEIRYVGVSGENTKLRQTAYSVLEISLASLHEIKLIRNDLKHPSEGWVDPWGYAEIDWEDETITVKTTVTDESGKLSLPNADYELLRVYLEKSEIPLRFTDSLVDALLDWTDGDNERRFNGAEEEEYKDLDPPYRPANKPLSSYKELLLIEGFDEWFLDENGIPNERFQKFKDSFSLYSFKSTNVNTLSESVLSTLTSLYNFDEASWRQINQGFDRERGTDDDKIIDDEKLKNLVSFSDLPASLLTSKSDVIRLNILVSQGDMNFTIECVVSLETGNNNSSPYPFTFLSFQENKQL